MSIENVHKKYVQKSLVFLYPLLGIKRGVKYVPIQSYIIWRGKYDKDAKKLICVYKPYKQDDEFKKFENFYLLGNPLFHDFRELENNDLAYIFTFDNLSHHWEMFIEGKYSQMSDIQKTQIITFYSNDKESKKIVESFLRPQKYFYIYKVIFNTDETHLKTAGELCSKPDLKLEKLWTNEKHLELN